MKPSTILITSSGVPKLIPDGVNIPEKPRYPERTKFLTALEFNQYKNVFYPRHVEAYTTDVTALEKEAESWPIFEDVVTLGECLPQEYAFEPIPDKPKKFRFKPGIYKEVMIPEHEIVEQWQPKGALMWFETNKNHASGIIATRQIIRFLPETASEPTIEDKRKEMARETWIKNVMRVKGWDREKAEMKYEEIVVNAVVGEVTNSEGEQKTEPTHFEIAFQNLTKVLTLIGNKRDTTPGLGGIQILVKEAKEHLELLLSEIQSFEKGEVVGDPAVKEGAEDHAMKLQTAYWAGRLIGYDQAWEVAQEIVDELEWMRTRLSGETKEQEQQGKLVQELIEDWITCPNGENPMPKIKSKFTISRK